jgi:membrane protease YdiL (CAAX protease family)
MAGRKQPRPSNRTGRSKRSGNPAVRSQPAVGATPSSGSTGRGNAVVVWPAKRTSLLPDLGFAQPPDGAQYPQLLRGPGHSWWRSLLGVVMGLSFFLLLTAVISQSVVALSWAITARGSKYATYVTSAFAFERPSGMLGANLGIASLIPISIVLMVLVHRVNPRWLLSVEGRLRWKYLLACLGLAAVVLNGVMWLSTLAGTPLEFSAQKGFWAFLAVILLTSPLQAAAEEIFFRGYLMQAMGSLYAQPWFGVVGSSVIFALFHGTQNLPLFVDRLAFGLLAAILVWRTGGLEAGIAAHVINNVFAYVIAGLTTSIATVKAIQSIGWLDALFDVGGFALFAVLAWLLARRLRLRTALDLKAVTAG